MDSKDRFVWTFAYGSGGYADAGPPEPDVPLLTSSHAEAGSRACSRNRRGSEHGSPFPVTSLH
jgi:hypothetical protein